MRMFRRFLANESGSIVPMVGLTFILLVGVAGYAVDTVRASLVQAKLSSSLDAAGLAAGSSISTANIRTEAQKYVNANFANGYDAAPLDLQITISADQKTIDLAQSARLPTTLMRVLGQDSVTVGAASQITRSSKGLELVLALDNTGSMETGTAGGTRMSDLKAASHDLVNILYGDKQTIDDLWIGLVPFSHTVNIGSSRTGWMDGSQAAGARDWGPTSWGGCVEARLSGDDQTDAPPSVRRFTAYYFPDDNNDDDDYNYNDWITYSTRRGVTTKTYNVSSSRGPNVYCPKAVTPMTANRGTVENAIDAMVSAGNTHVNLGAVWGWRMLSPR